MACYMLYLSAEMLICLLYRDVFVRFVAFMSYFVSLLVWDFIGRLPTVMQVFAGEFTIPAVLWFSAWVMILQILGYVTVGFTFSDSVIEVVGSAADVLVLVLIFVFLLGLVDFKCACMLLDFDCNLVSDCYVNLECVYLAACFGYPCCMVVLRLMVLVDVTWMLIFRVSMVLCQSLIVTVYLLISVAVRFRVYDMWFVVENCSTGATYVSFSAFAPRDSGVYLCFRWSVVGLIVDSMLTLAWLRGGVLLLPLILKGLRVGFKLKMSFAGLIVGQYARGLVCVFEI
eukprot:gene2842-1827_t